MADSTAAAAPAAKAPPPPPVTPSGKAPQAFDVRLALAKNLGTPRADGAAPPPAATTAEGGNIDADPEATEGEAEATETAETEGAEAEGGETAETAEGGAAEGGDATPEAQLEAVTKAFESGDIEAMAKALQRQGVKVSGPTKRAFRAFHRRIQKADERDRKADERDRTFEDARQKAVASIAHDSRQLSARQRELGETFGWAVQLAKAWEDEDMLAVGKALEKGCKGATLATITQRLATGKQGKTPEEKAIAEERRKLEEDKRAEQNKAQQAEEAKRTAAARDAAMGRVGEALKAHPYLQTTNEKGEKILDAEALGEVFSAYEASWNGEKFTKTARQCADELQEKLTQRAKARGLVTAPPKSPPAPAGKPGTKKPAGKPAVRTIKDPPRTTTPPKGSAADLEATRANRLAQARRLTEMQRRGVR